MNPHHTDLLAHGYEFKRKYPKMGQTGPTQHYVHKETGHKVHVEKMHRDVHSLYSDDGKGRQLLVKDAAAAAKHGGLKEAVETLSEDLNSALKELKQELAGGKEYTPEMLKGIADDWEVNPALLIRKFKEATGNDPADYKIMDKGALDKTLTTRAEAKAREIYKQRGFHGGVDILGKKFTYNNNAGKVRPGVAIAYSRAGLEYVSVDTGEHRGISFSNQHDASNYLRKHLL